MSQPAGGHRSPVAEHLATRRSRPGPLVLEQLGLSRPEVLASATCVAAEALGLGEVTGTLTPGLRADIVALDRDPLGNLTATRGVRWVMRAGVVTKPASPGWTASLHILPGRRAARSASSEVAGL
jgi:hypothetical protein